MDLAQLFNPSDKVTLVTSYGNGAGPSYCRDYQAVP